MKKQLFGIKRDVILAGLAIAVLYLVFHITGIGCPIKFITGISCPGCGMTRAIWSLVSLSFGQAFYYHPLWPLTFAWPVAFFFRKRLGKAYKAICVIFVVAFLLTYVIRFFTGPDEVVSFDPVNGAIGRAVRFIIDIF